MNDIINIVSVIAAFGFGVGCLYLLMDTTIGRLKVFHSDSAHTVNREASEDL